MIELVLGLGAAALLAYILDQRLDQRHDRNNDGARQVHPPHPIILELEAGHDYCFRYLLDGDQWPDDWHADKYVCVPSPHSDYDSIVTAEVPLA